ncbi:MAG: phytanoyl-CoA dioxygenase family protein [Pseudomonadales bacterium]
MPNTADQLAISPEDLQIFREQGVLLLRKALHPEWLTLIEMGLGRVLGDPSVGKARFFQGQAGEFQETIRNFDSAIEIKRLLFDSPIADYMAVLTGSASIWYYSDEFFIKDAGGCERTPWHQDTPYFPVAGEQLASVWITLDPLPRAECLEFIRGSHLQTMYDGFDPANPGDLSASYYEQDLPKLPDIEANRDAWDIVAWDLEPGDLIFSSPSILHGGGPTALNSRRRALAVRCFGEDVIYAQRPPSRPTAPFTPGLSLRLQPGEPLRSPWYPQLRPVPDSQRYG